MVGAERRPYPPDARLHRSRTVRLVWALCGLLFVALGGIGVVVPGLPTTGFLILAAWCFSHSSPRLEAWLLSLPRFGPMISDYRAGLGMPRSAKRWAIGSIVVFSTLSCVLLRDSPARVAAIAAVALVGVLYVGLVVPTREKVMARRSIEHRSTEHRSTEHRSIEHGSTEHGSTEQPPP